MPELPEVETIKRGLSEYLVGHSILDIQIEDPLRLSGSPEKIIGSKVVGILRRGKGLIIAFDNDFSIAIHVKMTGQLIYRGERVKDIQLSPKVKVLPNAYTRVIFHLNNDAHLFYNDVRRFGWLKIVPSQAIHTIPFFQTLGPEPTFAKATDGQVVLTEKYFKKLLKTNKSPIKTLLLNQQKIGGVGNIYANDALYEAKIDPRRPSNTLSPYEVKALFHALHEVMAFSIEHGAASDTNYVDALGRDGRYQDHFRVYGRTGEKCSRCQSHIIRVVLGGRGTFLCPTCQK